MNRTAGTPLVLRAIAVVEQKIGLAELATRLKVPDDTLLAWRNGHVTMPERNFLLLVDLLTDVGATWEEWDGAKQ